MEGLISVCQLVVGLISLTQTQQDLVCLLHTWLRHLDRLETPAWAMFDVIAQ